MIKIVKIVLRRSKIIGIVGLSMMIIGLLYLFAILPLILRHVVKKQVALKQGWPMREIWSKLPFTTEMHVYMFNITNHLEIGRGAKPVVQEIGPFVYDVCQAKVDQIDHEDDDTLSYVARNTYYFNIFKSAGLSDELEIYFPHLLIMSVSNGPMKHHPPQVSWTSRAIDALFDKPESAFFRTKVRTVLFDGFPLSCDVAEDYFAKVLCNDLEASWTDYRLRRVGDTYYGSIYGWMNGSYDKETRIRINRGLKSLKNLGRVVEINGKTNISTWKDKQCDEFAGTDGTIFPPFLKPGTDVAVVYAIACRKLALTYQSMVEFAGLELARYTTDVGTDGNHVPEEKCYCITPETCLRKGMFDTFTCTNAPIIASNPHFYKADPYYATRVDTLAPETDKHMLYVDFNPLTGLPARAHMRVQLNFELFPIEKFRLARNYSYSMLPMLWADEVTVLPESLLKDMRKGHKLVKLARSVGYVFISAGLLAIAAAASMELKSRRDARKLKEDMATKSRNGKVANTRAAPTPGNLNSQ